VVLVLGLVNEKELIFVKFLREAEATFVIIEDHKRDFKRDKARGSKRG